MFEARLGRYDRIDKCDLFDKDNIHTYKDCYILTGKDVDDAFEVDLTGNLDFNELIVKNRVTVKNVSDLNGLTDFINNLGNNALKNQKITEFILVGGSHDMAVYQDLSFGWLSENTNLT